MYDELQRLVLKIVLTFVAAAFVLVAVLVH
jgi:hypothetical protein